MINEDVVVTWGIGHLVGLEEFEAYDPKYKTWSRETLPILPDKMKYQINKKTSKQFTALKGFLKEADSIIIATDNKLRLPCISEL